MPLVENWFVKATWRASWLKSSIWQVWFTHDLSLLGRMQCLTDINRAKPGARGPWLDYPLLRRNHGSC